MQTSIPQLAHQAATFSPDPERAAPPISPALRLLRPPDWWKETCAAALNAGVDCAVR